jgi:hypothetical protein
VPEEDMARVAVRRNPSLMSNYAAIIQVRVIVKEEMGVIFNT